MITLTATTTISKYDLGVLHDIFLEITGVGVSDEDCAKLLLGLPEDIKCDIIKYGISDTEVRDIIYVHLKKGNQFVNNLSVAVIGYDMDYLTENSVYVGNVSFGTAVAAGIDPQLIIEQELEIFLPIDAATKLVTGLDIPVVEEVISE
jgi:hypothetical protein